MKRIVVARYILGGAIALLTACNTISGYDQVAYEHATNAKVDTLALMDKATTSYDDHVKDIEAVQLELAKAAEYDNGRPLNRFTIELWKTLRGDKGILNRFLHTFTAECKGQCKMMPIASQRMVFFT